MLKHFLQYLMFGLTMFAAAAPAVGAGSGDGGAGDGAADDGGSSSSAGADDAGLGDLGEAGSSGSGDEGDPDNLGEVDPELSDASQANDEQRAQQDKDKETADFKALVSRRLVALKKEAPELAGIFQKYPKVQEQIEASFRRDMAYRELYPTVAEARQMREQFPNGMADVEQLMTEVGEVEQLDKDFYGRDAQGNYAGHTKVIQNMYQMDRDAAVSLFRTLPKEWSRLDPQSYNEVMGSIVGATLAHAELPQWLAECVAGIDDPKNLPMIKRELQKMQQWSQGFMKRKTEPSEEERRIQSQRAELDRTTQQRKQEDQQRFHQTFVAESRKLQDSIVRKHPAVAQMLATKSLTEAKKAEIVGKIRTAIQGHLKTSRSFMSKLRPIHSAGKLKESLDLQRVAWSYPWVLNKFVRQVMAEETPNLVRQNPGARRAAAAAQRPPAGRSNSKEQPQRRTERTGPYQEGGMWFKKDGSRFTTAEILRGLHLKA
jgi:hypothetical protein